MKGFVFMKKIHFENLKWLLWSPPQSMFLLSFSVFYSPTYGWLEFAVMRGKFAPSFFFAKTISVANVAISQVQWFVKFVMTKIGHIPNAFAAKKKEKHQHKFQFESPPHTLHMAFNKRVMLCILYALKNNFIACFTYISHVSLHFLYNLSLALYSYSFMYRETVAHFLYWFLMGSMLIYE